MSKKYLLSTILIILTYLILALLYTRNLLLAPGTIGHNWDWSIPVEASSLELYGKIFVSPYLPIQMGQVNLLGVSTFPYYVLLGFLGSLGLSGSVVSKGFLVFINTLSALGMYSLIKSILNGNSRCVRLSAFLGGLLYGFSPLLFNDFIGGATTQVFSYSFIPWFVLFYFRYLRSKSLVNFDLLISLSISFLVVSSLQNIILSYIILSFINFACFTPKNLLKHMIFTGMLFLLNIYWWMPAVAEFYFRSSPVVDHSFFSLSAIENTFPSLKEGLFGLGYFRDFYKMTSPFFGNQLTYILLIISLVWIIWGTALRPSKPVVQRLVISLLLLYLLSLIFVTGSKPPFGIFVTFLYEKFPLFSLFRTSHHFVLLPTFSLGCLFGLGCYSILKDISLNKRFWVGTVFFLVLFIWVGSPFISGDLNSGKLKKSESGGNYVDSYQLSPGYKSILSILQNDSNDGRIFYFPADSSVYFTGAEYQSEAQGFDPFLTSSRFSDISRPSKPNQVRDLVDNLTSTLINENNLQGAVSQLKLLNVRYIVLRKDVLPAFGPLAGAYFAEGVREKLDKTPGIEKIVDSDEVCLYRMEENSSPVFISTSYLQTGSDISTTSLLSTPGFPSGTVPYSEANQAKSSVEVLQLSSPLEGNEISDTLHYSFEIKEEGNYGIAMKGCLSDSQLTSSTSGQIPLIPLGYGDFSDLLTIHLSPSNYLLSCVTQQEEVFLPLSNTWIPWPTKSYFTVTSGNSFNLFSGESSVQINIPIKDYDYSNLYQLEYEQTSSFDHSTISFVPNFIRNRYFRPIDETRVAVEKGEYPIIIKHSGNYYTSEAVIRMDFISDIDGELGRRASVQDLTLHKMIKPSITIIRRSQDQPSPPRFLKFSSNRPDRYDLSFEEPSDEYLLALTTPFDSDWKLSGLKGKHVKVFNFANGWLVKPSGGDGNVKNVTVEFTPSRIVAFSRNISLLSFLALSSLIIFRSSRRERL